MVEHPPNESLTLPAGSHTTNDNITFILYPERKMENPAFTPEEQNESELIVENDDNDDELRELPLEPYTRVLYVLTWPALKIHECVDEHFCRIKIVVSYAAQIAWLIFLIVAMAKDFLRALPVFIVTLLALLYSHCRGVISRMAKKTIDKCHNDQMMFYVKLATGLIIILVLIGMLIYQVATNPICLQSLIGLVAIPMVALMFSSNASRIQLRPLVFGLALQVGLGLVCFQLPPGRDAIEWVASLVQNIIKSSNVGALFFFDASFSPTSLAFGVMPIILFISILIRLLFHLGIIPAVLRIMGAFVRGMIGITSPEALSVLGSMFLGQIETLMLIAPLLHRLTPAELITSIGAGFASISGSVLFAYIAMGISAFDLFTATVTAVPATIVIAKIIQPEIHFSRFQDEDVQLEQDDSSLLDSAMKGAQNGCKVILTVSMILIGFYSVLSLFDEFIGKDYDNYLFLTKLIHI